MSIEAVRWALRDAPDVPPQCVSVLVGLAEHADRHGRGALPSAGTLAAYARKSERQVRYDLERLTEGKLIRPGDQSLAAYLPVNRRPVVYDLAVERITPPPGVQPTAPQGRASSGVQPASGVQSASPRQPIAPQSPDDLQEQPGVQPIAPQDGASLGCNAAQPGVQPIADKPPTNPKSKPSSRRRDLNEGREDAMRLCIHLADRIEANTGERPQISAKWLTAARLMLDNDKRTEQQIHRAIDWCQDSEFWRSNILSMPTLRDQYRRLRLQAQRNPDPNGQSRNGHAPLPENVSPRDEHRYRR